MRIMWSGSKHEKIDEGSSGELILLFFFSSFSGKLRAKVFNFTFTDCTHLRIFT